MSKAAPRPELEKLHDALAKELVAAIKDGEARSIEVTDAETGEIIKKEVRTRNAAVLNAARQFLKDNGVECAPGYPSDALKQVKSAVDDLPFPDGPGSDDESHTTH